MLLVGPGHTHASEGLAILMRHSAGGLWGSYRQRALLQSSNTAVSGQSEVRASHSLQRVRRRGKERAWSRPEQHALSIPRPYYSTMAAGLHFV